MYPICSKMLAMSRPAASFANCPPPPPPPPRGGGGGGGGLSPPFFGRAGPGPDPPSPPPPPGGGERGGAFRDRSATAMLGIATAFPRPVHGERDRVRGLGPSPAGVDDEATDGIDAGIVAGVEHRRRRHFLDDRRAGDRVSGQERLA